LLSLNTDGPRGLASDDFLKGNIMASSVGFVGLGNIGGRVVAHLVQAGHDVAVFDLNAAAVEAAVAVGARAVSSPVQAADMAEALFLSLPTPSIVEGVVTDVLQQDNHGLVIVDHSTIDPDTSRRLAQAPAATGASFMDAPVSGGVQGAEAGTLAVMIGGDEAAVKKPHHRIPTVHRFLKDVPRPPQRGQGFQGHAAVRLGRPGIPGAMGRNTSDDSRFAALATARSTRPSPMRWPCSTNKYRLRRMASLAAIQASRRSLSGGCNGLKRQTTPPRRWGSAGPSLW
jgi:hypothetical protein